LDIACIAVIACNIFGPFEDGDDHVDNSQRRCGDKGATARPSARNGRSMEAELRQILSDTLAPESGGEPNLADAIRRRFAPLGGVDLDLHPRVPVGEPRGFDE
jgi:plasmid stability protein